MQILSRNHGKDCCATETRPDGTILNLVGTSNFIQKVKLLAHVFFLLRWIFTDYEMVLFSKNCLGQIPIDPKFSVGSVKKNVERRKKSEIEP